MSEFSDADAADLTGGARHSGTVRAVLHAFDGTAHRTAARCRRRPRLLRQHELYRERRPSGPTSRSCFAPAPSQSAAVRVDRAESLHLRMAHKIRVPRTGGCAIARRHRQEITVYVSTALHENNQLRRLVRRPLRGAAVDLQRAGLIHGLLSDTAVFNHLSTARFSPRSSRRACAPTIRRWNAAMELGWPGDEPRRHSPVRVWCT